MKTIAISLFQVMILVVLQNCSSLKKSLISNGNKNDAIKNAILDFSKSGRLYKKDSVFSVWASDTVYRMVSEQIDDRNARWIRGKKYNDIIGVSIIAVYNKFLLTADIKAGSINRIFPSRYIEQDGKLFFWWDDDYPLTEELLAALHKYNLLQDDEDGLIKHADFSTDDAHKGAHYYFCRNNLMKYKKVITNRGMGYYDVPKLNCN